MSVLAGADIAALTEAAVGWQMHIHSIHVYHKTKITGADGTRCHNPNFDQVSGQLLDLKSKDHPRFKSALARFAQDVALHIATNKLLPNPERTIAAVIPSSQSGQTSHGLAVIAAFLKQRKLVADAIPDLLVRHTTIPKLAHGGNRSITTHLSSVRVDPHRAQGNTVLLLDDIATTGNSFAACEQLLDGVGAVEVICLALARTANE